VEEFRRLYEGNYRMALFYLKHLCKEEKLPVRYKSLILLKDYYGFSYMEIAEITGSTESSIKVSLFRARSKFKEVYKANE
jgi:hypothetical protein